MRIFCFLREFFAGNRNNDAETKPAQNELDGKLDEIVARTEELFRKYAPKKIRKLNFWKRFDLRGDVHEVALTAQRVELSYTTLLMRKRNVIGADSLYVWYGVDNKDYALEELQKQVAKAAEYHGLLEKFYKQLLSNRRKRTN